MSLSRSVRVVGAWCLILMPAFASAQSSSSGAIAGVVRDASGAVLPGVTVEAASPALIEKVRVAVSDDQGRFNIVDLRPGTYAVTFTLPGFATLKREGIELTAGFTATVNGDLKVGSLEETVVVTGASPVVDIQNVRTQTVLSREVIDSLPSGKTVGAFATLTLGVTGMSSPTVDVGGNKGETFFAFSVHGGRTGDSRTMMESMEMNYGGTGSRRNQVNQAAVQEVTLETRGMSADSELGGVQINVIPKEGGNAYHLYASLDYGHGKLQGENLTDEHRALGVTEVGGLKTLYDLGIGVGGRVKRDKLWFYSAYKNAESAEYHAGIYFNATPAAFTYTPDLTQQKYNTYPIRDYSGRLTWQAAAKHKVTGSISRQDNCTCYKLSGGVDINRAPEASTDTFFDPIVTTASWSFPSTNRLLIDAGTLYLFDPAINAPTPAFVNGTIAKHELTTGFKWGARMEGLAGGGNDYGYVAYRRANVRGAVSYITGSHAVKAGFNLRHVDDQRDTAGVVSRDGLADNLFDLPISYQLRNGLPTQITQWAAPNVAWDQELLWGLYAQDQWTLSRLTINGGIRLDTAHGTARGVTNPGGLFRAPSEFPDVEDVPDWKDVSPRVGAAYDLFGNGRTALKISLGRYVAAENAGLAGANNPASRVTQSATRTWNDTNGNLSPDCVLTNPLSNGECGQISDLNLGRPILGTTYDPELLRGWGKRGYNWQTTLSIQHELAANVGVGFGYYRTTFGNFTVTENRALTPADYDTFCVTGPTDARLPTSGERICGLYDVKPERFGQVSNFITFGENFGDHSETYDGVDFNITTRLGEGRLLQGGVSLGRTALDTCYLNDHPNVITTGYVAGTPRTSAFCDISSPWTSTAQVKIAGVYPLPGDVQISGTLQNISTFPIEAARTTPNAEIVPSLGRNLGSCRGAAVCNGTVAIPLVPAATFFGDRLTQLDLRVTKVVRIGAARLKGMVDAYNIFNSGATVNVNNTYGTSWQRPLTILGARTFKLGGQLDW